MMPIRMGLVLFAAFGGFFCGGSAAPLEAADKISVCASA